MVEYKAEKICQNVEGKDKDMKKKGRKQKIRKSVQDN